MRCSDLNRLRKILIVVLESGGGMLLDQLRLKYLLPLRYHMRRILKGRPAEEGLMYVEGGRPVLSPPALRARLERLGPTFVKLGQILSMRADLIGVQISEELAKLQSNAAPFPYEVEPLRIAGSALLALLVVVVIAALGFDQRHMSHHVFVALVLMAIATAVLAPFVMIPLARHHLRMLPVPNGGAYKGGKSCRQNDGGGKSAE